MEAASLFIRAAAATSCSCCCSASDPELLLDQVGVTVEQGHLEDMLAVALFGFVRKVGAAAGYRS